MCLCVYQQEEDVLDMLAECEAEERDGKMFIGSQGRGIRGPKVTDLCAVKFAFFT